MLSPTPEQPQLLEWGILSSEEWDMPLHPNASLVQDALRAVARGESETLKRLCTDDVQWHATGRTPWSGNHQGFEAVVDYLGRLGEAADVFHADLADLLVSEERVATVMQISARRGDRRLEVQFVILYRIAEGKIAEVWSAPLDPHATDAFWAEP
jgi:ketosteroid isomerase-like protein